MLPQQNMPGIWLAVVFMAVATAGLGACTPWPGLATGGLAERHATDWGPLRTLQERYDTVLKAGADRLAAGRMEEAHLLLIRAQREHEGALVEDADVTLAKAEGVIAGIEHDVGKRARQRRQARN